MSARRGSVAAYLNAVRPKGKTEAELALEIRQWLQLHGWRVHRVKADRYAIKCPNCGHAIGQGQKKHEAEDVGTCDYVSVRPDSWRGPIAHFYWEAKREEKGETRMTQRVYIDDARKRGYLVLEAPRSVEEVEKWLTEEGLA